MEEDKKEESIEQIIKILEQHLENSETMFENFGTLAIEYADIKRIANVLSRLKQLEEENKELLEVKISASAHNQIEKLRHENEELKNLANNKQWISPCYVAQNYIHRDKIKEKFDNKINDYRQQRMQLSDGHFWESAENVNRDRVLFIAGETLKEFKKELLGEE